MRRCNACDERKPGVGAWPDSLPLCPQCLKAWRMGYRCGEEAATTTAEEQAKATAACGVCEGAGSVFLGTDHHDCPACRGMKRDPVEAEAMRICAAAGVPVRWLT